MTRKDLRSVQTDLAALAGTLPTQHVARPEPPSVMQPDGGSGRATSRAGQGEDIIQFSLSLRKSLRKELARIADESDLTMRAFVLLALREKGLHVTEDDLLDLRKERGKGRGLA
jgi:hypothetical protein